MCLYQRVTTFMFSHMYFHILPRWLPRCSPHTSEPLVSVTQDGRLWNTRQACLLRWPRTHTTTPRKVGQHSDYHNNRTCLQAQRHGSTNRLPDSEGGAFFLFGWGGGFSQLTFCSSSTQCTPFTFVSASIYRSWWNTAGTCRLYWWNMNINVWNDGWFEVL